MNEGLPLPHFLTTGIEFPEPNPGLRLVYNYEIVEGLKSGNTGSFHFRLRSRIHKRIVLVTLIAEGELIHVLGPNGDVLLSVDNMPSVAR